MTREAPVGPPANPSAERGDAVASGLRVRGRYRVVNEIAAGPLGTVHVGEDESTGHRVVIRFLPRNFANTSQAAHAALRMGRSIMAASTSHKAMARVLEFGELDGGGPYTVTEFVEGRRLDEMFAADAPLDIHAALHLALELGGAVETLHNLGFVHGAITPRNVMVLEDGRLKLLDVELSALRNAREVHGSVDVDPPAEYMAPEQIQKGPITEKTDVYSYGVILHQLLTGVPPFQGTTREAIFTKHLKEPPVAIHRLRDGVPASVSRAVALALYKQPDARPLMGDVLNLLWTGAHGPAPRRTRVALIAGGSLLAVAAIGAVVWGALALRAPSGVAPTTQPTARPAIDSPAPPLPTMEPRRPSSPPVAVPRETGGAVATEIPTPPGRAPAPAPAARPGAAPTPAPPVGRAPVAPRPSAATASPVVPSAPPVRTTTPPPSSIAPRAPDAPPAPSAPTVSSPGRSSVTTPIAPGSERREQPQTPSATAQPAPVGDTDDSGAVIDWLLRSHGQ